MTQASPPQSIDFASVLTGMVGGMVLGGVVGCVVFGVFGYRVLRRLEADVADGWKQVPVVIAAVDLAAGQVVGLDDISQRSVPSRFVSTSVVKPENASYVVGQRLNAPMRAGDLLLWTQFDLSWSALARQCAFEVEHATRQGGAPSRASALEDFQKRVARRSR